MVLDGCAGHSDGMTPVTVWPPTWPQMVAQAQASTQPSLVTWAMDIIPALRCGTATDPNMALTTARVQTSAWPVGAAQVTQISMALAAP